MQLYLRDEQKVFRRNFVLLLTNRLHKLLTFFNRFLLIFPKSNTMRDVLEVSLRVMSWKINIVDLKIKSVFEESARENSVPRHAFSSGQIWMKVPMKSFLFTICFFDVLISKISGRPISAMLSRDGPTLFEIFGAGITRARQSQIKRLL